MIPYLYIPTVPVKADTGIGDEVRREVLASSMQLKDELRRELSKSLTETTIRLIADEAETIREQTQQQTIMSRRPSPIPSPRNFDVHTNALAVYVRGGTWTWEENDGSFHEAALDGTSGDMFNMYTVSETPTADGAVYLKLVLSTNTLTAHYLEAAPTPTADEVFIKIADIACDGTACTHTVQRIHGNLGPTFLGAAVSLAYDNASIGMYDGKLEDMYWHDPAASETSTPSDGDWVMLRPEGAGSPIKEYITLANLRTYMLTDVTAEIATDNRSVEVDGGSGLLRIRHWEEAPDHLLSSISDNYYFPTWNPYHPGAIAPDMCFTPLSLLYSAARAYALDGGASLAYNSAYVFENGVFKNGSTPALSINYWYAYDESGNSVYCVGPVFERRVITP
jgi:hypothetical protein